MSLQKSSGGALGSRMAEISIDFRLVSRRPVCLQKRRKSRHCLTAAMCQSCRKKVQSWHLAQTRQRIFSRTASESDMAGFGGGRGRAAGGSPCSPMTVTSISLAWCLMK
jgi:hypothetical protein